MQNLIVRGVFIHFKRNLGKLIKESGKIFPEEVTGDHFILKRMFRLNPNCSLQFACQIANIYYLKSKLIQTYIKSCPEELFDNSRFEQYLHYRKENPSDSFSQKYFHLLYGNDWQQYVHRRKSGAGKMYDPAHIAKKHNLSMEDAVKYIQQYKKNKATSKENFLKKHGAKEGEKLFKKFQQTSKHSEKKYLELYGEEEGRVRWQEYVANKKRTSKRSIQYWLEHSPSLEEAERKRAEFHRKNFNSSSVEFWINRGLSEKEAVEKVRAIFQKKRVNFCAASKESLKYFKPLYDFFKGLGKEPMLGIEGSREFHLFDRNIKRLSFYDFCLSEEKIIIEFHGEKFHPNPNRLSTEEWITWRSFAFHPEPSLSAEECHQNDLRKRNLAESNNFKYLEIWSEDSFQDNIAKLTSFFAQHNINIDPNIF